MKNNTFTKLLSFFLSVLLLFYAIPLAIFAAVVGYDYNIIPDIEKNKTYHGITTNKGIGSAGAEFHVGMSQTRTIDGTEFNIFDLAKRVYHKIVGWAE